MAVRIKIVADYDNKGMTKATRALDNFAKGAQVALAAVAAATAGLAIKSVQEFAKFDAAMTESVAIMGNVSDQMRGEMADAARQMALTTTFSAEQAAQSYFFLASAGLDAAASIEAMPTVASFAQAGMFDMALATDLLTDAQSALGLTIRDDAVANMENMARVSDVLVKANTLANASVQQFSEALTNKAGASLRAVGKDVEEGVAVLAAFADQGIKGAEAGTQFSIIMRDLTTKAIDNKEKFAAFGLEVFDSAGELRNMGDIVGDLEVLLAGMSDETQKATLLQLGFSDKSLGALTALLGTSDAIKTYESALRDASGITQEVAEKQLDTFNAQLGLLQSAVNDVFIEIGEQLTPALGDLVEKLKVLLPEIGEKLVAAISEVDFAKIAEDLGNFIVTIVENIDEIAAIGEVLLVVAGSLAVYRIAASLAATAQALLNSTLLLSPWGLLAVAVAGLTAALVLNNGEIGQTMENYKLLQSQTDQTNYSQQSLADSYREGAWAADKYGVQTDELRHANLLLEGAANGVSGELNRFNNIKLGKLRSELSATNDLIWQMYHTGAAASAVFEGILDKSGKPVDFKIPALPKIEDDFKNIDTAVGSVNEALEETEEAVDAVAESAQAAEQNMVNWALSGIQVMTQAEAAYAAATAEVEAHNAAVMDARTAVADLLAGYSGSFAAATGMSQLEQAAVNLAAGLREVIAATDTSVLSERNAKKLTDFINQSERQMLQVARLRDDIAAEIKRTEATRDEMGGLFDSVYKQITGEGDITRFQGSANSIIKQLQRSVDAAREFQQQLKDLRAAGLSEAALEQIRSAGVQGGGATATALLRGGETSISEINALLGELDAIAYQAGSEAVESMYGVGLDTMDALLAGLYDQQDELEDVARDLARSFEESFNAAFQQGTPTLTAPSLGDFVDYFNQVLENVQAINDRWDEVSEPAPGGGRQFFESPENLMRIGLPVPIRPTPTPSGNGNITINITAGMGANGAEIGQLVVDAITRYENTSGRVFSRV